MTGPGPTPPDEWVEAARRAVVDRWQAKPMTDSEWARARSYLDGGLSSDPVIMATLAAVMPLVDAHVRAEVSRVWAEAIQTQQLADNAHDFDLRQAWAERDAARAERERATRDALDEAANQVEALCADYADDYRVPVGLLAHLHGLATGLRDGGAR